MTPAPKLPNEGHWSSLAQVNARAGLYRLEKLADEHWEDRGATYLEEPDNVYAVAWCEITDNGESLGFITYRNTGEYTGRFSFETEEAYETIWQQTKNYREVLLSGKGIPEYLNTPADNLARYIDGERNLDYFNDNTGVPKELNVWYVVIRACLTQPEELTESLQAAVDAVPGEAETLARQQANMAAVAYLQRNSFFTAPPLIQRG